MIELFLIFFLGALPSLFWLLFWNFQDIHPEEKKKIFEIFALGGAFAFLAYFLESFFPFFGESSFELFLYFWFGVGLIEEVIKYLPLPLRVFKTHHFDEPIDVIIYLVSSSLGFSMMENIFYLSDGDILFTSITRGILPTFFHTLSTTILGFFVVLSFFYLKKKTYFLFLGFLESSFFHGLYDFLVEKIDFSISEMKISSIFFYFKIFVILFFLLIVINYLILKKVKKIKPVCKI